MERVAGGVPSRARAVSVPIKSERDTMALFCFNAVSLREPDPASRENALMALKHDPEKRKPAYRIGSCSNKNKRRVRI